MSDKPGSSNPLILAQAVREFLAADVRPELSGHNAYTLRVATNMLAIAERQIEHQAELDAFDATYLDNAEIPDLPELSRRLRQGEIELTAELITYLKQRTLKRLQIDNPRYWGYLQALKIWPSANDVEKESS